MSFIILELGKDVSSLIWKKLNRLDRLMVSISNGSDHIDKYKSPIICDEIVKNGYLELLKWARKNGCSWDSWLFLHAAKYEHLEILEWLRENGCPWYSWTI